MKSLLNGLFVFFFCSLGFAASPIETLEGEFVQGGLVFGKVKPGAQLRLDKQLVAIAPSGDFTLGFDRDAPEQLVLSIDYQGEQWLKSLSIARREYRLQHIEGIAKSIMQPSAEAIKRIRADAAQVRKARAQLYARMDFMADFQWPLKGPITGVYGSQRVYNGVPKRPHYGVDVAAPIGTPLTTPAPGVVSLAHTDMFYSGGTLIIDHGYGLSSTLMHLSKVLVKVGDEVTPGDIIAEVGATGRATGPHLDWRMNWHGSRIDPQLLVPAMTD